MKNKKLKITIIGTFFVSSFFAKVQALTWKEKLAIGAAAATAGLGLAAVGGKALYDYNKSVQLPPLQSPKLVASTSSLSEQLPVVKKPELVALVPESVVRPELSSPLPQVAGAVKMPKSVDSSREQELREYAKRRSRSGNLGWDYGFEPYDQELL